MFCLDIETTGTESDAAVLSVALVYFDETKQYTFEQLIDNSCFVKFNLKEQIKNYKRTVEKETLDWWKKQCKIAQEISLMPSDNDVTVKEGIKILRQYAKDNSVNEKELIWTRGSLDQIVLDSLFRSAGEEHLFKYSHYRDMRTAIDLLKETSKGGYCEVLDLDMNKVFKHTPVHDCALDVMMLLYGK